MPGPANEISVAVTSETSKFDAGMKRAAANTDGFAKSIFKTDQAISKMANVGAKSLTALSAGMNAIDAAARGGTLNVAALGTQLLGAFAMGGPVAAGLTLLTTGIGLLIGGTSKAEEAAKRAGKAYEAWLKGAEKDAASLQKRIDDIAARRMAGAIGSTGASRNAEDKADARAMRDLDAERRASMFEINRLSEIRQGYLERGVVMDRDAVDALTSQIENERGRIKVLERRIELLKEATAETLKQRELDDAAAAAEAAAAEAQERTNINLKIALQVGERQLDQIKARDAIMDAMAEGHKAAKAWLPTSDDWAVAMQKASDFEARMRSSSDQMRANIKAQERKRKKGGLNSDLDDWNPGPAGGWSAAKAEAQAAFEGSDFGTPYVEASKQAAAIAKVEADERERSVRAIQQQTDAIRRQVDITKRFTSVPGSGGLFGFGAGQVGGQWSSGYGDMDAGRRRRSRSGPGTTRSDAPADLSVLIDPANQTAAAAGKLPAAMQKVVASFQKMASTVSDAVTKVGEAGARAVGIEVNERVKLAGRVRSLEEKYARAVSLGSGA